MRETHSVKLLTGEKRGVKGEGEVVRKLHRDSQVNAIHQELHHSNVQRHLLQHSVARVHKVHGKKKCCAAFLGAETALTLNQQAIFS